MKKIIAMLLACLMVIGLFAGCTPAADETPDTQNVNNNTETEPVSGGEVSAEPAEKETIQLTVWVGENYVDVTNEMVEAFKAANTDYNYEITVAIESESTCKDTVLNDIEAAADVFTFADDQMNALLDANALQEVLLNPETIIAENAAGAIAAASDDGKLYAYPMSASNGYFLYYDANFFSAEDITSLNAMCEKAAAEGKKVAMSFAADGGWYIYSFFAGAGLNMTLSEDGVTNVCDWNCPTGEAVCQGILDLVATGGFVHLSDADMVAAAKNGDVVALINGTWNSGAMQEAYGDGYACAKLPTFKVDGVDTQMHSFAGYKLIGVNPTSENVGHAMLLAQWLTNEENQIKRFETVGDGPSNINAAASEAVLANPAIAALATQSQYAVVQRVGGNYWASASALGAVLEQGNPEGRALSELLDEAVAGITG